MAAVCGGGAGGPRGHLLRRRAGVASHPGGRPQSLRLAAGPAAEEPALRAGRRYAADGVDGAELRAVGRDHPRACAAPATRVSAPRWRGVRAARTANQDLRLRIRARRTVGELRPLGHAGPLAGHRVCLQARRVVRAPAAGGREVLPGRATAGRSPGAPDRRDLWDKLSGSDKGIKAYIARNGPVRFGGRTGAERSARKSPGVPRPPPGEPIGWRFLPKSRSLSRPRVRERGEEEECSDPTRILRI